MINYRYCASPLGQLRLVSRAGFLVRIEFPGQRAMGDEGDQRNDTTLDACALQLGEYFSGTRRSFELPMATSGTAFQETVWQALRNIPFGEVRSYRDIATAIGNPGAVRAVGAANGKNPLPIVVPCHRVIGNDGRLTGFSGGLAAKRWLLELEGAP
ncbi:MAG: methylated-DNA--[protein]-cysteine S-methyltransferase [Halioglobus sp.]